MDRKESAPEMQNRPGMQRGMGKGMGRGMGMPPHGQLSEEERMIMPDFVTLRRILFKLGYAIVAVEFLVECFLNIYAYLMGLRESSVLMAIVLHILLPTGVNLLILLATNVLRKRFAEEDMRQNIFPVIMLLLICITTTLTHCTHTIMLSVYCVPIAATTLFSNKKMCRGVTGISIGGAVVVTIVHFLMEENPDIRLWIIPDGLLAICSLIFVSAVTQTLLFMTKGQKDKLVNYARTLKEEQHRAEAANIAKSAFLANMSHEIRTPINAILGMNEMILRENKDEQIDEYARSVHTAGNSLLYLVNDVLDISKIESGKLEIVETNYDMASFIHDCYNMIAEKAEKKGLEFKVECDPNLPAQLRGDEVRFRQVVTNLLSNAVKYTERGSITLAVESRREQDQFQVVIEVRDTGIGIKEENIEGLFTQFTRFDLEKNRNIEGTGLGLAISKQLVDLMRGGIQVHSIYGIGSSFTVTIPQQIIDATPMGDFHKRYRDINRENAEYKQGLEAPNARILVVDDVEVNLKVIVNLLKATKIQVDTANSGEQCIFMATQKAYDVIFLDHMMPEMDGVETYAKLKKTENSLNKNTPVIMLTANAISGVREQYLKEGFSDYLSKPVSGDKLEQMLIKYLPEDKIQKEDSEIQAEAAPATAAGVGAGGGLQTLLALYPQVDTALGLSTCGDSMEAYIDIMKSFAEDSKIDGLNVHYGQKNTKDYQILVHGTKSAAQSIGFTHLSEMAKALEQAAREENWNFIEENHTALIAEYQRAIDAISQAFAEA